MKGTSSSSPPLPIRTIAVLSLCGAAHFYSICSIFSYAAFLAVDQGWANDLDSAGKVSGLLASSLTGGRIPTAALWGWLADTYGRRPCVLASMLAVCAGNLLFGFCNSLAAALLVRAVVLGGMNGWLTLLGLLAREVPDDPAQQTEVVSYIFSACGFVMIGAPSLASLLYGLIPAYPALVPSMLGSLLGLLAAVLAYFFVPETQRKNKSRYVELGGAVGAADEHGDKGEGARSCAEDDDGDGDDDGDDDQTRSLSLCDMLCMGSMPTAFGLRTLQGFMLFSDWDVLPLYAVASREAGGLAATRIQVGIALGATAGVNIFYTALCMPRIAKILGLRRSILCGSCWNALCMAMLPITSTFDDPAWRVGSFIVVMSLGALGEITSGVAAVGVTNNAIPIESKRGAFNGVGTTLESLGKALGPVAGANLFAIAVAKVPNGLGATMCFCLSGGMYLVMGGMAISLPSSVEDKPRRGGGGDLRSSDDDGAH